MNSQTVSGLKQQQQLSGAAVRGCSFRNEKKKKKRERKKEGKSTELVKNTEESEQVGGKTQHQKDSQIYGELGKLHALQDF